MVDTSFPPSLFALQIETLDLKGDCCVMMNTGEEALSCGGYTLDSAEHGKESNSQTYTFPAKLVLQVQIEERTRREQGEYKESRRRARRERCALVLGTRIDSLALTL